MSGGEMMHVIPLTIGGLVPVEARSVPRGYPLLDKSYRVPGKSMNWWRRSATPLKGECGKQENRSDQARGDSM
jgi:hypothetical protein